MKKKITGCLATTALTILVLGIVALLSGGHFLCIETVYQILLANVLIHGWISVVQRFESPYFLMEITLELGGVLLFLIGLGSLFSWYESVSVFTLILMGIIVYVLGCVIQVFQIQNDLDYINDKLAQKEKKQ
ncbi:MAG: DUF3021 family protein [Lachnospiraceae bacterium]|nr:DUF3021 family protein [Lachnospiraceae bacterium]